MEDSTILELLRKKSPQTTLEIAKSARMSWHVVQEQLLEMQIDGLLDRITVGRQNLWFLKGQKFVKGLSAANTIIVGMAVVLILAILLQSAGIFSQGTPNGHTGDNEPADSGTPFELANPDIYFRERTLEENLSIQQYKWITYDNSSNTIKINSHEGACTIKNPCTLTDVYNSGLGKIDNIHNYFVVNSTIEIESGFLLSEFEHIFTEKPWVIRKNGRLRLGITDGYNKTYGSVFFETDVIEEINNAALVNEGILELYDSNYKIYSEKQNNLYQSDDAVFRGRRFDIQRIKTGTTTFYIPINAVIDDYVRRDYVQVQCAGKCTIGEAEQ